MCTLSKITGRHRNPEWGWGTIPYTFCEVWEWYFSCIFEDYRHSWEQEGYMRLRPLGGLKIRRSGADKTAEPLNSLSLRHPGLWTSECCGTGESATYTSSVHLSAVFRSEILMSVCDDLHCFRFDDGWPVDNRRPRSIATEHNCLEWARNLAIANRLRLRCADNVPE